MFSVSLCLSIKNLAQEFLNTVQLFQHMQSLQYYTYSNVLEWFPALVFHNYCKSNAYTVQYFNFF